MGLLAQLLSTFRPAPKHRFGRSLGSGLIGGGLGSKPQPSALPAYFSRRSPARIAGEVAGGAVVLAAGSLLAYWLKERTTPEAEYTTVVRDGPYSLRRYAPLVVATTEVAGTITEALDEGFRRLSAYIFAKKGGRGPGADDQQIAMTVPVTASPGEHPGVWKVRFVMPTGWFRSTLPEPAPGVTIEELPGRLVAAVRFAGRASDPQVVRSRHDQLLGWVRGRGLRASGDVEFAGYNAPIIPGPARRNEWWVPVDDATAA